MIKTLSRLNIDVALLGVGGMRYWRCVAIIVSSWETWFKKIFKNFKNLRSWSGWYSWVGAWLGVGISWLTTSGSDGRAGLLPEILFLQPNLTFEQNLLFEQNLTFSKKMDSTLTLTLMRLRRYFVLLLLWRLLSWWYSFNSWIVVFDLRGWYAGIILKRGWARVPRLGLRRFDLTRLLLSLLIHQG